MTTIAPKIQKASEISHSTGLVALIYGQEGSGKTTFASTAQDSRHGAPVLFMDFEGGTKSIRNRDDIDVWRIDSYYDIEKSVEYITSGKNDVPYKTIVVDSLSNIQEMIVTHLTDKGKPGNFDTWNMNNDIMKGIVRDLKTFSEKTNTNVVITALAQTREEEGTSGVVFVPKMSPGAAITIGGIVDMIGWLEAYRDIKEKKTIRRLFLEGTRTTRGKVRQELEGSIPLLIENPTMSDILNPMFDSNTNSN